MSKSGMYVVDKGNPVDNWNDRIFIKSGKGTEPVPGTDVFYRCLTESINGARNFRQTFEDTSWYTKVSAATAAALVAAGIYLQANPGAKEDINAGLQKVYTDMLTTNVNLQATISHASNNGQDSLGHIREIVANAIRSPYKEIAAAGGTGLAALTCGCTENPDDDDSGLEDLGEPIDEVNHYVGTEGFNVDVDDIFGEKSIYYLAEQETGAKSPIMEFKPCAKVVEETYLGEDGAEIIKYKIGNKRYDEQEIKKSGINIEDSYLPKDKIPLMIKKLPDGTYDLSELTKSTEAVGWEHISLPGYFPGSDKNPKATDNIIGNNGRKPELRMELTPPANGERLIGITIFNKAYVDIYGILGLRSIRPGEEIPDKGKFRWANERTLTPQDKLIPHVYKELFDGELYYGREYVNPKCSDALITGTPDYEYGTIQKKAA